MIRSSNVDAGGMRREVGPDAGADRRQAEPRLRLFNDVASHAPGTVLPPLPLGAVNTGQAAMCAKRARSIEPSKKASGQATQANRCFRCREHGMETCGP